MATYQVFRIHRDETLSEVRIRTEPLPFLVYAGCPEDALLLAKDNDILFPNRLCVAPVNPHQHGFGAPDGSH